MFFKSSIIFFDFDPPETKGTELVTLARVMIFVEES